MPEDPRSLIVELCAHFYRLGWVSGTGGRLSLRDGDRVFMAVRLFKDQSGSVPHYREA